MTEATEQALASWRIRFWSWLKVTWICISTLLGLFVCLFFLFVFISLAASGLSCSMWDLVPWPGIKPGPSASGVQSFNHWTTRDVPVFPFLFEPCSMKDLSSQMTRNQTCTPVLEAKSLNHWASREAPFHCHSFHFTHRLKATFWVYSVFM